MADLFDYLYWRGDLSVRCFPVNPVDGLILSWMTALPLKEARPLGDAMRALLSSGELDGQEMRLARMLSQSERFRNMQLLRFEERFSETEQMQFAALTVLPGDGTAFVLYRATDATLVGWKEDFNLAYADEVPAQREAVQYLQQAAAELPKRLRIAGHSKGGNLAVYAAAMCGSAVQPRIDTVYNFDGPGMNERVVQSAGYRSIEPRVETYLPESSIVGILLERSEQYYVVRSDETGPMQHIPHSWQVLPDGFELASELSRASLYADRTLRDWLGSMSAGERMRLVDALYEIVGATGARTLGEIAQNWSESSAEMLDALVELDFWTKAALLKAVGKLIASAVGQLQTGGNE